MKILLIAPDSVIPNLALMKISQYHKNKKDQVSWKTKDPDVVYCSIVFSENRWKGVALHSMYPEAIINIGGSGFSYQNLPENIEHIMPDYSLYPEINYSIGFTTRGCIRNCKWCIVPKKEGKIKANADIYEFWDPKHKHIMLLDNNILALPDHFEKIAKQLIEHDLTVDYNQGLDIRLLNNKNAKTLSKLRVKPDYRFAFDHPKDKNIIEKKMPLIKKHLVKQALFYVLVGFNTTIEEDLLRLNFLKDHGQRAYVMRYKSCRGIKIYNDLSAWANQQQFFGKMNFDEFRKIRHSNQLITEHYSSSILRSQSRLV
jgi:hypothetical protein